MNSYLVIFDHGALASSDAAVGTKPTSESEITAFVEAGKIAYVNATDEVAAAQAVEIAYNSSARKPIVIAN